MALGIDHNQREDRESAGNLTTWTNAFHFLVIIYIFIITLKFLNNNQRLKIYAWISDAFQPAFVTPQRAFRVSIY
jgi:hypothetical protein